MESLPRKPAGRPALDTAQLTGYSARAMGARQRAWAARVRLQLIEQLGGVCVDCGSTEKLEFDHRVPRRWVNRHLDPSWRISKIKAEIAAGEIELRCPECNKRKGKPRPEYLDEPTPF